MQGRIIRGADGKSYREMPKADGSFEYIPIQDVPTHLRQIDDTSHVGFFQRDDKQKLKRQEALTRQIQQAAQRVDPGPSSQYKVRVIKDEEFFRLNKLYQDAVAKGEQNECDFQPLVTYQHKILRARPILQGEVGVYGNEILRLEAGYGSGNFAAVGVDLGRKRDEMVAVVYDEYGRPVRQEVRDGSVETTGVPAESNESNENV